MNTAIQILNILENQNIKAIKDINNYPVSDFTKSKDSIVVARYMG